MDRAFRRLGAITATTNAGVLAGLALAWLLSRLVKAGIINHAIAFLFVLSIVIVFLVIWWWWKENYMSLEPARAEKFYRYSFPFVGVVSLLFGLFHFVGG